jgi:translation initiation factor IF-2
VTEVKAGFECGMRLDSFDKYEEGDVIETFEIDKIRPSL